MLSLKGSRGSFLIQYLSFPIGIIGMMITISGTLIPASHMQSACFVIGGLLLTLAALIERQPFFIALQIIVEVGALTAFIPVSPLMKFAIPVITSFIVLVYFAYRGNLSDYLSIFGTVGICFLAIGYAVVHPLLYLAGGVILTIYSFCSFRQGVKIALLWAILNGVFSVTSMIGVLRYYA